ncbi:MAG TPA: nicotinate (nicotinamide) nucleotide adenylyltransferase [Terracidiphilus sp.]|nr:nicotinate (nicotinamide) nucleotide adenylyltransferase [Terracidiphilus sp.]
MHEASAGGRRIAFFGGSFDPPHRGHLAIAAAARDALQLDQVLFAPVASQPLKPFGATAGFADRLAMTRLAIAHEPAFAVSLADAPSPTSGSISSKAPHTPNYTIDTLLRLRSEYPADTELLCLIGADSFLTLRQWHRGAEIPFIAPLVVASRPGQSLADLASILPPGLSIDFDSDQSTGSGVVELHTLVLHNIAGASAPFYLLPGLYHDVSASQIRRQVRAALGHPRPQSAAGVDLPDPVASYILAHNLYR